MRGAWLLLVAALGAFAEDAAFPQPDVAPTNSSVKASAGAGSSVKPKAVAPVPADAPALDWPPVVPVPTLDAAGFRDVFLDPRRKLPVPLPGSVGVNVAGDVPTTKELGVTERKMSRREQAQAAQIRFWLDYYARFPRPVSVVRLGRGGGYVSWSGGVRQSVGETRTMEVGKAERSGEPGPSIEFVLKDIVDGGLRVSLLRVGSQPFADGERFVWHFPWSWHDYLGSGSAGYLQEDTLRSPAELQALMGGSETNGVPSSGAVFVTNAAPAVVSGSGRVGVVDRPSGSAGQVYKVPAGTPGREVDRVAGPSGVRKEGTVLKPVSDQASPADVISKED